jgi:phosphoribosylanthranilate isomerase
VTVRVRVKTCGLRDPADVRAAAAAGADAVGVVAGVSVDSHREVSLARAADLAAAAPPFLATTLVTMPDDAAEAAAAVERTGADHVQVHGLTDPAALDELRGRTPARVVAAVGADADLAALDGHADALLLDSTDESGAGGTGETHDWEAARRAVERLSTPVVLAGGLTPENVDEAVRTVRPYAVDAASGVERDGAVDGDRLRAFVDAARGAEVAA